MSDPLIGFTFVFIMPPLLLLAAGLWAVRRQEALLVRSGGRVPTCEDGEVYRRD